MNLASAARDAVDSLLDMVYPPRCLVCHRDESPALCAACVQSILPLKGPYCDRCGIPEQGARGLCRDCESGSEPIFAWSEAVGKYAGVLREAIHLLKYKRKGAIAAPLGALLAESIGRSPRFSAADAFDCIVAVPLHRSRYLDRGFNQAERVAEIVAKRSGRPLIANALIRTRKTANQVDLPEQDRLANVAGAFEAPNPDLFMDRRPLLIDDVLTTCATMNECSRIMMNAGAKRVYAAVLARGL